MEESQTEITVGSAWLNKRGGDIYAVVTRKSRDKVSFTAIYGPEGASTYTVGERYFLNAYNPVPTD